MTPPLRMVTHYYPGGGVVRSAATRLLTVWAYGPIGSRTLLGIRHRVITLASAPLAGSTACVYCGEDAAPYDEHEACVERSVAEALEDEDV